jgi:hypothetical protein
VTPHMMTENRTRHTVVLEGIHRTVHRRQVPGVRGELADVTAAIFACRPERIASSYMSAVSGRSVANARGAPHLRKISRSRGTSRDRAPPIPVQTVNITGFGVAPELPIWQS